jgi:hypothetical protein
MNSLADALRRAAADAGVQVAETPSPPPEAPGSGLPDPLASPWVALLRQHGADVPTTPTMGQLVQRSDACARALKEGGRRREAEALTREKDTFLKARAAKAWALVKARFAELDLNEKAYRALKQEDADPERVLTRLRGPRGEALRGAGAARLREALS